MAFNRTGPRPRTLDPIKAMVAKAAQDVFIVGKVLDIIDSPDNVDDAEAQVVSPTETLIRVKTSNQGIRYFTVKVSENLL